MLPAVVQSAPSPTAGRRSRAASVAPKLAVLGLGLLAPLLLLELALRLLGPIFPGTYQLGVLMIPHADLGRYHEANASVWYRTDEFTTHVRTDEHGFRGPPLSDAKPAWRTMVIGDSFVEARQVMEGETAVAHLGRALGDRRWGGDGPSSGCQVINGGVASWGPADELAFARDVVPRFAPQLVLLVFYMGNDVAGVARRAAQSADDRRGPAFRLDGDGRLVRLPNSAAPDADSLPLWLRRASWLASYVQSGLLVKLQQRDEEPLEAFTKNAVFATNESAEVTRAWRLVEAIIASMAAEVRAAGGTLAVVAAPAAYQVHEEEWRRTFRSESVRARLDRDQPNRRLAEIAGRARLPYLDLSPPLREAGQRSRLYFPFDSHWTVEGNAIVGQSLAAFVRDQGLAPPGCFGRR
jgi:hypothetical protein